MAVLPDYEESSEIVQIELFKCCHELFDSEDQLQVVATGNPYYYAYLITSVNLKVMVDAVAKSCVQFCSPKRLGF